MKTTHQKAVTKHMKIITKHSTINEKTNNCFYKTKAQNRPRIKICKGVSGGKKQDRREGGGEIKCYLTELKKKQEKKIKPSKK